METVQPNAEPDLGAAPDGTVINGQPAQGTAAPAPTYAHEWFVATTGNDSAAGNTAAPFKTISKAISIAGPGDRILVRAGSYRENIVIDTRDGTATQRVLLEGEQGAKILPAGASTLVLVHRPYWTIKGFEIDVEGNAAYAVGFYGNTAGSKLQKTTAHGGTSGAGVALWGGATDVTVEDNVIFNFRRSGADSHGVHVAYTTKNSTIRNNRIYDNSGDAVQCEGPEPYGDYAPADGVMIEGNDMSGDYEQAVDIKTCKNVTIRNNKMTNYVTASVIHYSASNVLYENNVITSADKALALGGNHTGPMPAGVVIRGNKMRAITGTAIQVENADHPVIEHNTILDAPTALRIGGGEGGPTDGLKLQNNILGGKNPLAVGSQAPGLVTASNLFQTDATIGGQAPLQWTTAHGDGTSKTAAGPLATSEFAPVSAAIDAAMAGTWTTCGAAPDIGAVETGC